jgi:hypothetical protein
MNPKSGEPPFLVAQRLQPIHPFLADSIIHWEQNMALMYSFIRILRPLLMLNSSL